MTKGPDHPIQTLLDSVLAGKASIEIPLRDDSGNHIGLMRPLNAHHLEQMDVMAKLTEWRNENMASFLTHFVATPERTRSWVQNVLLKSQGQMLWLVYDHQENLVGHFGFKNLTDHAVLLDNAMRGERKGHPKLFVVAGRALVHWLWQTTSVESINGIVMAENVPAMMMNRQLGFGGWKRHPLIKRTQGGDTHWDIGLEGQTSPDNRYCFLLWMTRDVNDSEPTPHGA